MSDVNLISQIEHPLPVFESLKNKSYFPPKLNFITFIYIQCLFFKTFFLVSVLKNVFNFKIKSIKELNFFLDGYHYVVTIHVTYYVPNSHVPFSGWTVVSDHHDNRGLTVQQHQEPAGADPHCASGTFHTHGADNYQRDNDGGRHTHRTNKVNCILVS